MAKRILVVGATSSIAEHCLRIWGKQSDTEEVIVIGRDEQKLQSVLDDIIVRSPGIKTELHTLKDFSDQNAITALFNQLSAKPIDVALIAHGTLGEQQRSQTDLTLLRQVIEVNATSVAFFAEAIVSNMIKHGKGTIGIISSVAGDTARRANYHYGAAKAFVSFISEGLQHRVVGSDIHVCLIKPGPTQTPMTNDMHGKRLAPVSEVAIDIVNGMAKRKRIIYTPWKWRYVMLILRHLPWFIFKRLDI